MSSFKKISWGYSHLLNIWCVDVSKILKGSTTHTSSCQPTSQKGSPRFVRRTVKFGIQPSNFNIERIIKEKTSSEYHYFTNKFTYKCISTLWINFFLHAKLIINKLLIKNKYYFHAFTHERERTIFLFYGESDKANDEISSRACYINICVRFT